VLESRSGETCPEVAAGPVLVVGRGEHPERGVPAAAVVEHLDKFEDLPAQHVFPGPGVAVDQFFLQGREEALGDAVDAPMFVKSLILLCERVAQADAAAGAAGVVR
jgi:hypothetical protein